MSTEIKIKKKRGRPRKYKKDVPKKLKKRGRKKKIEKQVHNLYDIKKIELQTKKIEMKSIIVHLPIDINDYKNNNKNFLNDFLDYKPEVFEDPIGFDIKDSDMMNLQPEKIIFDKNKKQENEKKYNLVDDNKNIVKKVNNILLEFKDFKDKNFIRTDICCWHCCHKFKSMPCGIPLSYKNDLFYVFGIFCSFNCALTYNYNSKENENIIQERESLIHLLYKKITNNKDELKYAPEKEVLKMFGGLVTIEDFRKNNKVYSIIKPPLISLIPQLEEINFHYNNDKMINKLNVKKQSKQTSLSKLFKKK